MKHCQHCDDHSQAYFTKVLQMMWPDAIKTIYKTEAHRHSQCHCQKE